MRGIEPAVVINSLKPAAIPSWIAFAIAEQDRHPGRCCRFHFAQRITDEQHLLAGNTHLLGNRAVARRFLLAPNPRIKPITE